MDASGLRQRGRWPVPSDDDGGPELLARERALRAAVLIDAIRCLAGAARTRDRHVRQATMRWLVSRDTRPPFSFHNVCESLGLDPSRIRRMLLESTGGIVRIAISGGLASAPPVRRPRRNPVRYVVFQGGRRS